MKNSSRVPSLKSSLNIVSIANKEDNSAAIHITPGAKDLKNNADNDDQCNICYPDEYVIMPRPCHGCQEQHHHHQ